MSQQYDFQAGFDFTALSSVTQVQLLAAINQLAPLFNIGGVIFQAGPSLASPLSQGVGGAPDVTNNPRFARYVWLNTFGGTAVQPTPYYYRVGDGKWYSTAVAGLSITNAEISATAAIEVTKLLKDTAYYIIRTNAAGTAVEWTSPANIFSSIKLPISGIAVNGADAFLKTSGGVMAWSTDATERAAFQTAISNLTLAQLVAGANGNIIYTVGGTPTWAAPATALPAGSNIPPGAIASASASTGDVMAWTGSTWAPITLALKALSAVQISVTGNLVTNPTANLASNGYTVNHGLGIKPKLVRVVAIKLAADATSTASASYTIGDEVEINGFTGSSSEPAYAVSCDATAIYIGVRTTGAVSVYIKDKLGAAAIGAIDETVWQFRAYAWA